MKTKIFRTDPGARLLPALGAAALLMFFSISDGVCQEGRPLALWSFEGETGMTVKDTIGGTLDPI